MVKIPYFKIGFYLFILINLIVLFLNFNVKTIIITIFSVITAILLLKIIEK
ncbi:hypothetical protein [Clostridium perfringens]|uniref:hypothetical protein n=1 Tax=Clostridium perfringens TaxID=1502 RepID=UPI0015E32BAC|nr:hypothetical protein [Clostridium perfringens]